MLDTVTDWCQWWRLSINVEKTNVVHFRTPGRVKTQLEFKCSGIRLEISECYKYLCLVFNEYIDKGRMATAVAKSANCALGLLIAKHKAFMGIPQDIYRKLYDARVRPIIEYAATIWCQQELSCISAIQNRASRYFMGVLKYTPNPAVQREMGWKTASHRQTLCVLRLWLRLMNVDREMIASKVFWHSYTLAQGRCKNWCFLSIKMFHELGMGFLTNENECVDKHSIFETANNCLHGKTTIQWEYNLNKEV